MVFIGKKKYLYKNKKEAITQSDLTHFYMVVWLTRRFLTNPILFFFEKISMTYIGIFNKKLFCFLEELINKKHPNIL